MQGIPALDLYRELEVDPAASAETIEAAWKSLLKRNHPDVAVDQAAAHERVKRLNLAHEWLSDPELRAAYDATRRPVRAPLTVTTRIPTVVPRRQAAPASAAPATPDAATSGGINDPAATAGWHNPYADYPSPGRLRRFGAGALSGTGDAGIARPSGTRRRAWLPALVIPLLLVGIVAVAGVSVLARPTGSATVAERMTGPPGAPGAVASPGANGGTGLVAGASANAADPRTLPSPDLQADLPAGCRVPVGRPLEFETRMAGETAKVVVAACGGTQSAGPIVYVATRGGWQPAGRLGLRDAAAAQGFSGTLSEPGGDEFGIAWRRPDGILTVSLYRLKDGLQEFWDSSSIGLGWSQAKFRYRAADDPDAAGSLVVEWADPATGTPNCPACRDHQMYTDTYRWDPSRPVPVLLLVDHVADGLGPQ